MDFLSLQKMVVLLSLVIVLNIVNIIFLFIRLFLFTQYLNGKSVLAYIFTFFGIYRKVHCRYLFIHWEIIEGVDDSTCSAIDHLELPVNIGHFEFLFFAFSNDVLCETQNSTFLIHLYLKLLII